jgi:RNA polymerase sigma-70 factor (ECF subfamily)
VVIFSTRAERQRQRRWAVDPDFDLSAVSDGEDPMRVALHRERAARVRLVIGELGSGRDRQVIERFYLREESKSEVCRALGIDESHFRRVVFRARERLRAVLVAADVESAK